MKYFITESDNGEINVMIPVPPNHHLQKGKSVIVNTLPELKIDQKYKIKYKKLKVVEKTQADYNTEKSRNIEVEFIKIDRETKIDISKGFVFDSKSFSLSSNAQINWQGLLLLKQTGLFLDTDISTIDNDTYLLTSENVNDFVLASHNKLTAALKTGRDKKQHLKMLK